MSALGAKAWAAATAIFLALAACDAGSGGDNSRAAPGPGAAGNAMAPDMSEPQMPAPTMAAPAETEGGAPRNAFIVCPGNPRCPPTADTRPAKDPD